jgi:hypothetical protein
MKGAWEGHGLGGIVEIVVERQSPIPVILTIEMAALTDIPGKV